MGLILIELTRSIRTRFETFECNGVNTCLLAPSMSQMEPVNAPVWARERSRWKLNAPDGAREPREPRERPRLGL